MPSAASQMQGIRWLLENGPGELELLLRAVLFRVSAPILVVDDGGRFRDASAGAATLFGLTREELVARSLDDFREQGEQQGRLTAGPAGKARTIDYTLNTNVLPKRHLLRLCPNGDEVPVWAQDFAFFLLDVNGTLATWYSGAERMLGYSADKAVGQHLSLMYPVDEIPLINRGEELKRSSAEGHFTSEGWRVKKDGTRFWANALTLGLRDANGKLQGFAGVLRDFSGRAERDQTLRSMSPPLPRWPKEVAISGIVSGEFDRIAETNDAFLELVGYSREELSTGMVHGPGLTPPAYSEREELAHEEGLRFGACTPFETELIRKDGTLVPVVVATAVLKVSPLRWITFVQDLREHKRPGFTESEDVAIKDGFAEIVGRSAIVKRLLALIEVVAPTNATVLILGETGTGKELVARAVHRISPRRDRPFITLNCAAIPTGLLESELFGYERGAFTGALSQKIGRFEMAHRGTLFLDEVGDIPLDLQPKLLRALQEKTFERLGGTKTIPIDVRLVAATNRNLTQMMGDKLFRSDLYYRLKVFPVTTPPLRDHPEDIPALVRHFTQKYAREMHKHIDKIPAETMRALVEWNWPGNVRELENFIERAVILSPGPHLRGPLAEIERDTLQPAGDATLEHMEREHVMRTLRETGGVVSKAAARLGMPRTTLNALMAKLGISRKDL